MKTINQTVIFSAAPRVIYRLLMDPKQHAAFTESKTCISPKVGGKISAYDGYIEGENLKLVPDQVILQSWRASDWPKGLFSEVEFRLSAQGQNTKLVFTQRGVPDDQFEEIKQGWADFYWEPMKAFLAKPRV